MLPILRAPNRPSPLLPAGRRPSRVRLPGSLRERPNTSHPSRMSSADIPSPSSVITIVPPSLSVAISSTVQSRAFGIVRVLDQLNDALV